MSEQTDQQETMEITPDDVGSMDDWDLGEPQPRCDDEEECEACQ